MAAYPGLEDILDIGQVGVQVFEALAEEALSSIHDWVVCRGAVPLALCQCLPQSLQQTQGMLTGEDVCDQRIALIDAANSEDVCAHVRRYTVG